MIAIIPEQAADLTPAFTRFFPIQPCRIHSHHRILTHVVVRLPGVIAEAGRSVGLVISLERARGCRCELLDAKRR